ITSMKEKYISLDYHEEGNSAPEKLNYAGILYGNKGYKLCWLLNQIRVFDFKRIADKSIYEHKLSTEFYLQQFIFDEPHYERSIKLISNKTDKGVLVKKMKSFDFFLLFENYENEAVLSTLVAMKKITEAKCYLLKEKEAAPVEKIRG